MMQETRPQKMGALPVRTLMVELTEGPDRGRQVSAEQALSLGSADGNTVVLTDPTVSRFHLELRPSAQGVHVRDLQSTNGTWLGAVRLENAVVPPGSVLRLGQSVLTVREGATGSLDLHGAEQFAGLLWGRSAPMRALMARIDRLGPSTASVLLTGESGTGKELVARALHAVGPRSEKPFVVVDCGALLPALVASEMFGHERGAFTGADRQHTGAFERAHGGTLFLDEVGELPLTVQSALLGALERRRFRRLGGTQELAVDVRILCATHRDLRAAINREQFRLDLFYRLAVVTLELPSLRERAEDIPLLLEHFLREAGAEALSERYFPSGVVQSLQRQPWPGNVRELRNLVDATLALAEPPSLSGAEATAPGSAEPASSVADPVSRVLEKPFREARAAVIDDFEERYLASLLSRTGGNVSQAARVAQMDRSHLSSLVQRHRLRGEG